LVIVSSVVKVFEDTIKSVSAGSEARVASGGKVCHLIENGMDLGHHVYPIDQDGCPFRRAESHVQNRTFFRDVDFFTPVHSIGPCPQARVLSQLQKELKGFISDAILGVIKIESYGLRR
jgi:hypothetical protein